MKRGQTTLFIVLAIVIVGGILVYFAFGGSRGGDNIPKSLAGVFDHYQTCIELEAKTGIEIAGIQGGKIETGPYIPGSEYAPFSSELNFLGSPVPYWYYVSGNGIITKKVPTKTEMEQEIERFIEERLEDCEFEQFYAQGFSVNLGKPEVSVSVEDEKVSVSVNADMEVSDGVESARKTQHKAEITSKLGKFYDLATEIYSNEKKDAFLEQYALDVLHLYAPVDGVEIQCAPKIWATRNVQNDLQDGLEKNFAALKFSGDYYQISEKKREYFVLDYPVDESVRVLYSKQWPISIEIDGDGVDDDVIVAEPVGLQEGLGILGFCYVPYHYVYDLKFPAMIQIYNNEELFQFPVAVIIDNNVPRAGLASNVFAQDEDSNVCAFETKNIEVNLLDVALNKVDGTVSYECFNQRCRLGESSDGVFKGSAPACVNGYLHVRADGYAEKKQLMSTNEESFADVVLEREYNVSVGVFANGREVGGQAIVSFEREDGFSRTAVIPEFSEVKLSEGSYTITVYSFSNTSINLPANTQYKCVDVPREGLLGFFGSTKEKCFDITTPASKIDYALTGGGTLKTYLLESELEKENLRVKITSFSTPRSVEELQKNLEMVAASRPALEFYG